MAPAWLDSLSEDWVSQPPSEASLSANNIQPLHSKSSLRRSFTSQGRTGSSRLPRFSNGRGSGKRAPSANGNSSNILSERSISDRNIPESHRALPRPTQENEAPSSTRKYLRRSTSSSTTDGSVVHNTVHQKPLSASVGKAKGQTPEWKRRLIHGDLAYGEQRDLFSSAATGLENIFKPPPPKPVAVEEEVEEEAEEEEEEESQVPERETTMPSSPPAFMQRPSVDDSTVDIRVDSSVMSQQLPGESQQRTGPRKMTYRMTDDSTPEASTMDDSIERAEEDSREDGRLSGRDAGSQEQGEMLSAESLSQLPLPPTDLRKVSTGSVLRHENFSPILITKHSGEDGKASYAPVGLSPAELRKRLEKLRRNHMILAETSVDNPEGGEPSAATGRSINVENTEDYEKIGGFVNFRRGGRSADGSFRHRLLSPELSANTSEMFPEESLQASTPKQFPSVRTDKSAAHDKESPALPRVPYPSPEKRTPAPRTQGSATSPLKLFGPYDTFTNQTLLRRISQFEDQMTDGTRSPAHQLAGTAAEKSQDDLSGSDINQAFVASPQKAAHREPSALFGAGDLDGYQFNEDFAYHDSTFGPQSEDESGFADESLKPMPKFGFDNHNHSSSPPDSPDSVDLVVNRKRQKSITSTVSTKQSTKPRHGPVGGKGQNDDYFAVSGPATPDRRDSGSDSKRPRTSPSKDPTPKRRRTLHRSDISYVEEAPLAADSVQSSHQHMQSALSRKRRDARDGDAHEIADPDVLANRQILRPRTPTPSQRSSVQRSRNPFVEDGADSSEMESVALASAVPLRSARASPLRPGSLGPEADRKPSIKTEDFINEANKIMAMIRGKSGRRSGLVSVEESEAEHVAYPPEESSFQESTREPFSRPPSREGRPVPRAAVRQEDPEVVEHLRKYEERSDIGELIGSSVRSLGFAQDVIRVLKEAELKIQDSVAKNAARLESDAGVDVDNEEAVVSDPPNIRISRGPSLEYRASQETFRSGEGSFRTHGSAASSASSVPTGSSRASDTRKTIAPQSVSHLIPDQVGNMVLDRERNVWVKSRVTSPNRPKPKPKSIGSLNHNNTLPSEISEDDPFAGIPDLTVDITMENNNLRAQTIQKDMVSRVPPSQAVPAASPSRDAGKDRAGASTPKSPSARLTTPRRGQSTERQSGRSSWSPNKIMKHFSEEGEEEEAVEHEIRLDEGREGTHTSSSKRRNLTISFSSPVASVIQDTIVNHSSSMDESGDDLSGFQNRSIGNITRDSLHRGRPGSGPPPGMGSRNRATPASRSRSRGPGRQISVGGGQVFVPRPVSRIDEQEEDNTTGKRMVDDDDDERDDEHDDQLSVPVEEDRQVSILMDTSLVVNRAASAASSDHRRTTSLSFMVSTPRRTSLVQPVQVPAAVISQVVGTMSLSPLSDFTARYGEPSAALEASYLVDDQRFVTGDGSRRVMSQTLQELVSRLAEVEPFEPYWEDMTTLELSDKRLSSVHKLGDFCPKVARLDISNNSIRNLSGVPLPVRYLDVSHNQLSGLTAWGGLTNLQHLDVSGNNIGTTSGLGQLVHLRSIKADNCGLTSLDGVLYHDGLVMLRARGNHIEEVDFEGTKLRHLTELDLQSNGTRVLENLDQLSSLAVINLANNKLDSLDTATNGRLMPSLKTLNLGENDLTAIDVKFFPNLKILHADKNRLHQIRSLSHVSRLDSLSLREQRGVRPLDVTSFLGSACEVRKLYLSGNLLEKFEPPVELVGLQLLELANCGLHCLPRKAATRMSNLRKLNINFNAIRDLNPLACLPRLRKLSAAGNRFDDIMAVISILETIPTLVELDMRDNPATLGFYPPAHVAIPLRSNLGDGNSTIIMGSSEGISGGESRTPEQEKGHIKDPDITQLSDLSVNTTTTAPATAPAASPATATRSRSEPFALAPQDVERDEAYSSRLDRSTRMHRRLYELVWVQSCDKLRRLDGLPLRRDVVTLRDSVWRALARRGLISDDGASGFDDQETEEDWEDDASEPEGTEDEETEQIARVAAAFATGQAAKKAMESSSKSQLDFTARAKAAEDANADVEARAHLEAEQAAARQTQILQAQAEAKAEAEAQAQVQAEAQAAIAAREKRAAEDKARAFAAAKAEAEAEAAAAAIAAATQARAKAEAEAEERIRIAASEAKTRAEAEAEERIRAAIASAKRQAEAEAEERMLAAAVAVRARVEAEAEERIRAASASARAKVEAEAEEKIRAVTIAAISRIEAEVEEKIKIAVSTAAARAQAEVKAQAMAKAEVEEEERARLAAAAAQAQAKAQAQAQARADAEAEAEAEAKARARAQKDAEKAKAEAEAVLAQAKAKSEAEAKARAEAEERARAATAQLQAQLLAKAEAEAAAARAARALADADAEQQARIDAARAKALAQAEAEAEAEAERRARAEALLVARLAAEEEQEKIRAATAAFRAAMEAEIENDRARAAEAARARAEMEEERARVAAELEAARAEKAEKEREEEEDERRRRAAAAAAAEAKAEAMAKARARARVQAEAEAAAAARAQAEARALEEEKEKERARAAAAAAAIARAEAAARIHEEQEREREREKEKGRALAAAKARAEAAAHAAAEAERELLREIEAYEAAIKKSRKGHNQSHNPGHGHGQSSSSSSKSSERISSNSSSHAAAAAATPASQTTSAGAARVSSLSTSLKTTTTTTTSRATTTAKAAKAAYSNGGSGGGKRPGSSRSGGAPSSSRQGAAAAADLDDDDLPAAIQACIELIIRRKEAGAGAAVGTAGRVPLQWGAEDSFA